MAGEGRRVSIRLTPLILVALFATGCATGFAGGSDPRTEEIRRLRERISVLEREARVREVELRRLRAALADDVREAEPTPATRPREGAPVRTAEVEDVAPRPEPRIEEADLAVEPIPSPPPPAAEPPPAPGDGVTEPAATDPAPTTTREAQELYDEAYSLFHQGRYDDAETRFSRYLELYPGTRLADNAQFWIGECRFARGDHEAALQAFLRTVERFPDGNKVPDAMVKAGKCLEALGDVEGARETYREIRRAHPGTAAAAIAEERLLMLR